jgi:hypothetical protein
LEDLVSNDLEISLDRTFDWIKTVWYVFYKLLIVFETLKFILYCAVYLICKIDKTREGEDAYFEGEGSPKTKIYILIDFIS